MKRRTRPVSVGGRRPPAGRVQPVLVWMDLEMTGLEPAHNVIVEIATIITDDELNIVAEGPDLVVHQPEEALAMMEQIVVEMHTKSGLLDQIRASTITLEEAGAQTLAFINAHCGAKERPGLAGNSIHQDRSFIRRYMPALDTRLHYRMVDVSTVKELARRWYPQIAARQPSKNETHRALDDIRESIDELRYYRNNVFAPIPAPPTPAS